MESNFSLVEVWEKETQRTYPQPPCRPLHFQTFPCRYSSQCLAHTSAGIHGRLIKNKNYRVREHEKYALKRSTCSYDNGKAKVLKWHTCSKVRLAAGAQDGIKLRLISSNFILPSGIQFLSPTHHLKKKKKGTWLDLPITFQKWYNPKPTLSQYLSILFGEGDVNSLSFVAISLDRVRHVVLIKHTSRGRRTVAECGICFERAHYESNLAESDKESAEVTGGVTADGILQALPILWKKGVAFF